MAQAHSSLQGAQSKTKNGSTKKIARTTFAAVISASLVGTFALPAYAAPSETVDIQYAAQSAQTLRTVETSSIEFNAASLSVADNAELLEAIRVEEERVEAERLEEERLERERIEQQRAQQAEQAQAQTAASASVPAGAASSSLLSSAYSQIGDWQDCTAVVERALRARGHAVGDLGTGIWQYDPYGTRVSLDSLQPGDILVYGNKQSGAHVAIYAGNGQAVHGGFPGGTVVAGVHAAWEPLTGAIRPN